MSELTLYELCAGDGRSLSPFVWRVKLAMAKKDLAYHTVKVGYTEVTKHCGGRFRTVPIIADDGREVCDSWMIADYLDERYPDRPTIFSCAAERATVRFFDSWLVGTIFPLMLSLYALDIHDAAAEADRGYYRTTREARIGRSLEAFVAGREERLPTVRAALEPVRATLAAQPFLGGAEPNFADMELLATFIWVGSIGTIPLLLSDDPLANWARAGLDLFGGAGRQVDLSLLTGEALMLHSDNSGDIT